MPIFTRRPRLLVCREPDAYTDRDLKLAWAIFHWMGHGGPRGDMWLA